MSSLATYEYDILDDELDSQEEYFMQLDQQEKEVSE